MRCMGQGRHDGYTRCNTWNSKHITTAEQKGRRVHDNSKRNNDTKKDMKLHVSEGLRSSRAMVWLSSGAIFFGRVVGNARMGWFK